ncbi:MAG: GNAT family N-acetyltransferase [Puia sp.]|nr:GNAT family N-acetyltransferase [Puia sp.]
MSITIRKASKQDFPAVLDLFREFAVFQKTPEKMHITLEELSEDERYFQCFVAEKEGRIAGFASFFFAYYSWTGRAVYLDDLYVQEDSRKYGIGKGLLFAVIEFAKENRCKSVRWLVSRWNTNAIEFYRSIGAEINDTEMGCVLSLPGSP